MTDNKNTFEELEEALKFGWFLLDDLNFQYISDWKNDHPSRQAIGYFPIYVPREIIHAAGMLPVGLFGGGSHLQVIKGDAYFQSYICHLPRSVIEMALDGNYADIDGFIFPSICDVIRNLSGVFKIIIPGKFIKYLDYPQNFDWSVGGKFYSLELWKLQQELFELNGIHVSSRDLNHSILLYNENRRLISQLRDIRSATPWKISTADFYAVMRAGYVMSVEDHNNYLENVITLLGQLECEPEDKIRVIITGSFCEQPPMGMIKTIENAGCYIVDDDFQLGTMWIVGDIIDVSNDPMQALAKAYLEQSVLSSSVYDSDGSKGNYLARLAKKHKADGVIFCAPSFCDPALLDRPELEKAMDKHHIKHISFRYHENLGQFQVIKEQVGTFSDSIKLWA